MRQAWLLFFFLMLVSVARVSAQTDSADINIKDIHYEPVTEDYFSDYKYAKLIVNYYCSDGWSANDRYSYEVVLIDSLLMVGFDSPETEGMNYISFQKKTIIPEALVDTIKNTLGRAGLIQVKSGIPIPVAAAHTKEVLIVKYAGINIAGGLFYYNMLQQDMPADKINAMIAKERKLTSSIGGDYDSVILAMRNLFPDLNALMSEALKIRR